MLSPPHNPRGEEKLKLLLGQLASIRTRLNGLAFQQGIFAGLALLVSACAIVVLTAFMLDPLAFLSIAGAAALICAAGMALAIRHVWRMHKSADAVAAIADARADLKGRLLTLVALQKQTARSPLWPYLVEDATLKREEFAPARIERRRVSRTLYAPLIALILAALVTPLASHGRRPVALVKQGQQPLTLNLRDLTIQPSDHSSQDSARLTGDPNTMRKLAQMLADAQRKEQNKDLLSRMKQSASDLAGNLQDKITGRKTPPLDIRLADNGSSGANSSPSAPNFRPPPSNGPQNSDPGSSQFQSAQPPSMGSEETRPGGNSPSVAMQTPPSGAPPSQPQTGSDSHQFADPHRSGNDDAGGASHGAGTDPEGLYGSPDSDAKSEGSFQIAIDARPGASGRAANRAFPPKVNAPLNTEQHADEPIGRTAVPAEDRSTIKRIFER